MPEPIHIVDPQRRRQAQEQVAAQMFQGYLTIAFPRFLDLAIARAYRDDGEPHKGSAVPREIGQTAATAAAECALAALKAQLTGADQLQPEIQKLAQLIPIELYAVQQ